MTGFNQNDFKIFFINGLEIRLEAIHEPLQPKSRQIVQELTEHAATLGNMFFHIARYATRSVDSPKWFVRERGQLETGCFS